MNRDSRNPNERCRTPQPPREGELRREVAQTISSLAAAWRSVRDEEDDTELPLDPSRPEVR